MVVRVVVFVEDRIVEPNDDLVFDGFAQRSEVKLMLEINQWLVFRKSNGVFQSLDLFVCPTCMVCFPSVVVGVLLGFRSLVAQPGIEPGVWSS